MKKGQGTSALFALGVALATAGLSSAAIADDRVQAVSSADGRLEVFVRSGSDDRIYHVWQTKAGSGSAATQWHWEKADTQLRGNDFVAGRDSAGRLFVAAAKGGVIHINAQPSAGTSFGDAWALDTHDVHGLALASDADKRIDLLTLSGPGAAWSTAETQTGNRTFFNHPIGGTKLRSIAPTPFKDGRLALVAVGGDRSVWWTSQTAPNANFSGWGSLAGHDIQLVIAGPNADGRLDVMALGADKGLYHRYELVGGGWSQWETEATGPLFEPMSMVSNADGRLEVFAHNGMGQIVHAWQVAPNGVWTPFTVLDVIVANTRSNSVTMMPDGRLVIAALGDGDEYPTINVAGQVQANGDWEAWMRPPTSEPAPPPKPKVTFNATPNNCYGPVGFTCSFTWSVANCGSNCTVSMVGRTGLGNYDTIFFAAYNAPNPGHVDVKPPDTNTKFTLSASSPAGSDSSDIFGVWESGPVPPACAGCMRFFFKLVPPSNLLPCSKKMYLATSESMAEGLAKAEFPGWAVSVINESAFLAVGC